LIKVEHSCDGGDGGGLGGIGDGLGGAGTVVKTISEDPPPFAVTEVTFAEYFVPGAKSVTRTHCPLCILILLPEKNKEDKP
jgi:hypothetical protein